MSVRIHSSSLRLGYGIARNRDQAVRRNSTSHSGSRRASRKASKAASVKFKLVLVVGMFSIYRNPRSLRPRNRWFQWCIRFTEGGKGLLQLVALGLRIIGRAFFLFSDRPC